MFSRCEVLVPLHVSVLAWGIPSVYFMYVTWHVFATLLLCLHLPNQTCFCSVGPISAPGADTHPNIKPTKLNTTLLPLYWTPSFWGTPFKFPTYALFPPFPPSSPSYFYPFIRLLQELPNSSANIASRRLPLMWGYSENSQLESLWLHGPIELKLKIVHLVSKAVPWLVVSIRFWFHILLFSLILCEPAFLSVLSSFNKVVVHLVPRTLRD